MSNRRMKIMVLIMAPTMLAANFASLAGYRDTRTIDTSLTKSYTGSVTLKSGTTGAELTSSKTLVPVALDRAEKYRSSRMSKADEQRILEKIQAQIRERRR